MRNVHIENSWKRQLNEQFNTAYMITLSEFLRKEISLGKKIYPQGGKIFSAFNLTSFDSVKIVILGQDPYHGPRQANGLSFSVEHNITPPPSLQNIFKELHSDLNIKYPCHGNLESWARQGVLLLNSCLTVEDGRPGSHHGKGWEKFTDAVLHRLNEKKDHIVFILWGRKAQEKARFIDINRHLVLKSPHPSPLSAYNGFFGSKPFSKANFYLENHGLVSINWEL